MEKRRDDALDLLKALAMLCVCLYHFYRGPAVDYARALTLPGMLLRALRAVDVICVPLFMMVNGALLLGRPFDAARHARNTARMLIGLFVWYLLTQIGIHAALHGVGYVAGNLPGILRSALYLYEYDGVRLDHLWFMQMLLAVYVLFPCLKAAFDAKEQPMRQGLLFSMGAVTALCMLTRDFDHIKPALGPLAHLDISVMSLLSPFSGMYGAMIVYFLLGGMLYREREKLAARPLWQPAALFAAGWALLFAEGYIMTRSMHQVYDVVYNGYACVPAMMMSAGVFLMAQRVRLSGAAQRIVRLAGRNTLAIYYTHWIIGTLLPEGIMPSGSISANLAKAVLLVTLGMLLGEGMRRIPLLRRIV